MGLYKVEGIVLRRRNLGEADRLVTVLTRDRGRLTVVARGARRPHSRLGGRLEPATRFRALVAEGRSLDVISQVDVVNARAGLRRDLERMTAVSVLLEFADRSQADRHPAPEVYRLLDAALDLVERGITDLAWLWFAARLLVLTGHRPSVARCVVCGGRLREALVWSVTLGGCAHAPCGARDPRAAAMSQAAAALLVFLLDAGPSAVVRASPGGPETGLVGDLLRAYAEHCWETRFRSLVVWERLRETAGRPVPRQAGL
ncbi:MAG: DNA repair protein RecO [Armatimonadota bacterium]|nr:DNA repair protein RecO [Armatimonadota bacterium]